MTKKKTKIRPFAKDCEKGSPEKIKNTSINNIVLLLKRHVLYCQIHSVLQLMHQGCLKNDISHVVSITNAVSPI